MNKMPKFVLLRAFEAAARLESFTLAASELNLTTSAISHQVRELEDYFGRALFVRRNRRVQATAEGLRLHDSLARIFEALQASCDEVLLAPKEQVLAVHCAPSLAAKWLGPRLPQFMKAHPEINIRLSTGAEPIDLHDMPELDIEISYAFARTAPGINVMALGVERIAPLCSPSLLDARYSPAEQIARLCLIDSSLAPVRWRDWFTANRLTMPKQNRPSFDRAAMAIAAAADGVGVALESVRLARRELANGELLELGKDQFQPLASELHFLSHRKSQGRRDKVQIFCSWLTDLAGRDC